MYTAMYTRGRSEPPRGSSGVSEMEGEFTKEQIDEFKEAFTVFDKGTSIYYVGIILDFC